MTSSTKHGLELLSLEETLTRAPDITEIVGDSPPVTLALHRLLLAVLHRSLGVLDPEAWKKVRDKGAWDATKIKNYFDKYRNRFDLFDKQYPFYQARDVRAAEAKKDSILQLIFESDETAAFFGVRHIATSPYLTAQQAARWLISYQSFDFTGFKSVEAGIDPKFKSDVPAPLINCAVALVRGHNLFETLMLNLYWYDDEFFTNFDVAVEDPKDKQDKPAWERHTSTRAGAELRPLGYIDLLTWQSRRVRLGAPCVINGELAVRQAVVIKGHRFADGYQDMRVREETMLAFRKILDPKKTAGFKPINFDVSRALWRDSHALFRNVTNQMVEQSKPLMFDWLNFLSSTDVGVLPQDSIFPVDYFGLTTKKKDQAKLLLWRHERLPLPLRYLRDAELCNELKVALEIAEGTALTLSLGVHRLAVLMFLPGYHMTNADWFKPRLPKSQRILTDEKEKRDERGSKRDGDIANLRKGFAPEMRYWSRLESEFRHLVINLAKDKDRWQETRESWWLTLGRVARRAFSEIVSGAGQSERTLRAAALAERWFEGEMNGRRKRYLKPD